MGGLAGWLAKRIAGPVLAYLYNSKKEDVVAFMIEIGESASPHVEKVIGPDGEQVLTETINDAVNGLVIGLRQNNQIARKIGDLKFEKVPK